MSLMKIGRRTYLIEHHGRCPNRKCPNGGGGRPLGVATLDREVPGRRRLLNFCGFCGNKLVTWTTKTLLRSGDCYAVEVSDGDGRNRQRC